MKAEIHLSVQSLLSPPHSEVCCRHAATWQHQVLKRAARSPPQPPQPPLPQPPQPLPRSHRNLSPAPCRPTPEQVRDDGEGRRDGAAQQQDGPKVAKHCGVQGQRKQRRLGTGLLAAGQGSSHCAARAARWMHGCLPGQARRAPVMAVRRRASHSSGARASAPAASTGLPRIHSADPCRGAEETSHSRGFETCLPARHRPPCGMQT